MYKKILKILNPFLVLIGLFISNDLTAQQVPDTLYNPTIENPMYKSGEGPVVFIDEGHQNFHTKDGRYKSFSNLLERDGYQVQAYNGNFNTLELSKGKILVISNALNEINVKNWVLPTPSAFTKVEIETVKQWVKSGGSLFLIADHMPMAGAAKELALEFEFEFTNGYAFDTIQRGPAYFNLKDKTLNESVITKGRNIDEEVQQIVSFTGQAFKIPNDATSILTLNKNFVNKIPEQAGKFDLHTTQYNVGGWSQGAFKTFGKGKIVVFGEAAMFSAQLAGEKQWKMGMNNEIASENYKLLLNIVHWLDGRLK